MTVFTFKRNDEEPIDFKRELSRFRAAFERDEKLNVDLATKHAADMEIGRQIRELFDRGTSASFPAAQAQWHERARVAGTDESALLSISMRGVLQMIKHPAAVKP